MSDAMRIWGFRGKGEGRLIRTLGIDLQPIAYPIQVNCSRQ